MPRSYGRRAFGARRSYGFKKTGRRRYARFVRSFRKGTKLYSSKKRSVRVQRKPSKLAVARQLAVALPNQVYLTNNQDYVTYIGVNNTKAGQFMWAQQQDVSSGETDSIAQAFVNLMPHDLGIVQQIMYQQLSILSGAVSGAITAQVLIKNWQCEATIKNAETGPIELTHYRCRATRDFGPLNSSTSPQSVLINGFLDTNTVSPPTGVTNPVTAGLLGATPFMNPRFTAMVHVLKSKKYYMKTGGKITLRYTQNSPRIWKNEDFNFGQGADGDGSTPTIRSILKGQHFSVFVINGTWATASAPTSSYRHGVGNASVGIIQKHRINYATITPQVTQTSAMNAVPGFTDQNCGFPLPIVGNQPYSAIGTLTTANGVRQYGAPPFTFNQVDAGQVN